MDWDMESSWEQTNKQSDPAARTRWKLPSSFFIQNYNSKLRIHSVTQVCYVGIKMAVQYPRIWVKEVW